MKTYGMGELFSGAGGLAWGALHACDDEPVRQSRIGHAWAVDFNRDACRTYVKNICPDRADSVLCKDVRDLNFKELAEIDAFVFGFPCNDFSVVGERKGIQGEYGRLYKFGVEALKLLRPAWFVAENVRGLLYSDKRSARQIIFDEFKDAGYNIFPHLYKFEEYGVPQTRHRVIVVGIREDIDRVFRVPAPTTPDPSEQMTCAQALENIPIDAANNERMKQSKQSITMIERLKYIKPGQNAFNADIPEPLRLHVKKARLSNIYRRLDPNKPAYTVTGSGGGGTHVYHWSEPRALTNRERARLQTFPDDFVFEGGIQSVRRQIGMAVPPRGAQIIFEAVLKTLDGIEYAFVDCNIPIKQQSKTKDKRS